MLKNDIVKTVSCDIDRPKLSLFIPSIQSSKYLPLSICFVNFYHTIAEYSLDMPLNNHHCSIIFRFEKTRKKNSEATGDPRPKFVIENMWTRKCYTT